MTRSNQQGPTEAGGTVYRVEPPRASDAIGLALRDAFARDHGLPEDMAAMLVRLSQSEHQRC